MIKPVKRNKRLKWIDSHYANFYKRGLAWRNVQIVQLSSLGKANLKAIKSSPGGFTTLKKLAIIRQMVDTTSAISRLPQVKGRVTK